MEIQIFDTLINRTIAIWKNYDGIIPNTSDIIAIDELSVYKHYVIKKRIFHKDKIILYVNSSLNENIQKMQNLVEQL